MWPTPFGCKKIYICKCERNDRHKYRPQKCSVPIVKTLRNYYGKNEIYRLVFPMLVWNLAENVIVATGLHLSAIRQGMALPIYTLQYMRNENFAGIFKQTMGAWKRARESSYKLN
jgi:hypothetical protein